MRVAIDTRSLRPPLAGIGHFTHRLTEAMLPLLADDETLLAFNGWKLEPLDGRFLGRVSTANSGGAASSVQRATQQVLRPNSISACGQLRRFAKFSVPPQARRFHANEERFDVFHAINYVPPSKSRQPVLPFVHDLSHVRHPQMHPKDRVQWLRKQLALVADAPLVQTNSHFSKREITAVLGIPAERIHVTYAAPGAEFRACSGWRPSVARKKQACGGSLHSGCRHARA